MKKNILHIALAWILLLACFAANAKESSNMPKNQNSQTTANKTDAGDCVASTDEFDIQINNVRAMLLGGGDLWWNFSSPEYEVPKGNGTNPLCSIFAGAIWISGLDAGGNLKLAGQTYRQGGNDYWPGPVTNGSVDAATCSNYDHHFSVLGADIASAQAAFAAKGTGTTLADIPNDVQAWPAVGNPYLSTNPALVGKTYNITAPLAPFWDANNDGVYDPVQGDYPSIPCNGKPGTAYADQMVFWVFNDIGNIHTQTNGQAIGVQVNALAFAFQTTDDINNMTFYNYQIINQSTNSLFQTYISQWVDPDNGCYDNDRVGCDTTRNLGFCYNGSTPDPNCANEFGYGSDLPTVGVSFFEGPLNDSGQQIGMSSFVYFTNGAVAAQTDPSTAPQYRNYQTGFWADGTPFTAGGTGYGGTVKTGFIFPGNPSDPTGWSECTADNGNFADGDRRFVESSGPFTMKPGISEYVTVGVPWVRPAGNGVGLCPNTNLTIGPVADKGQALFNTCFKLIDGPDAPTLQIRELSNQLIINLVNLPGSNNVGESYNQVDGTTAQAVHQYLNGNGDSTYKFQGYELYQVANANVGPGNLTDPTQAYLIAVVDIKDSITQIVNFIRDPTLGLYVPTLEVTGTNTGVVNSFNITTDNFAVGAVNQLANNQTYYYTAIAYAYNNFIPYNPNVVYDPANPGQPSQAGQLNPYLQGRNNFKIYSAIPHLVTPRDNGTTVNATWGQGVVVQRIEGGGNGGNNVQLNATSLSQILNSSNGFADTLNYLIGSDPLSFQVTDPIALKEADFELQFVDSPQNPIGATTRWFLHDMTNNDTVWSDRTLDRPYQQQIMLNSSNDMIDYGFSITLGTPPAVYTIPGNYPALSGNPPNRHTYNLGQSSLVYQDSTQPWLSFLPSSGSNNVTDWIRCGSNLAPQTLGGGSGGGTAPANPLYDVFDANWYYVGNGAPPTSDAIGSGLIFTDSNCVYNQILGGTWGPYCLTPNYSNSTAAVPYVYGPGFKWLYYGGSGSGNGGYAPPQNNLDQLASVDIVITPDKTQWSHCIVFETGEDETTNAGSDIYTRSTKINSVLGGENAGALKGQIRMAYSKDWNNASARDFLTTNQQDTGRSWFPGYAINVETGQRLNIAFGESSNLADQNGRDMFWNPTANLYDPITFPFSVIQQIPYFGGKQFIYVMSTPYDEGAAAQQLLLRTYDSIIYNKNIGNVVPKSVAPLYRQLMWTSIPYLTQGYNFVSDGTTNPPYIPYEEITVHLRIETPFQRLGTIASTGTDSLPRYAFSTKGLGITQNQPRLASSALDLIKIVPNPYLAYSSYETGANSVDIKITNLPNVCTVTIYSLNGTIIRVLNQSLGIDPSTNTAVETSSGNDINSVNVINTLDWDMKNTAGIPVASGIYLFHIEAPGIGQKTLKWFGVQRPADITDF
jgi:hypothetical protein